MSAFDVLASENPEEERMEEALAASFVTEAETDCSDAAIAEAAKSDLRAFGELYERYHSRIYRYVYHRVGSSSDAEDVTALVFMKALEALPSYKSRHNGFAPWIFRIARNAVVDYYRRRRQHTPLDNVDHEARYGDPVADVLGGEQREELRRLVRRLSADQREVILMRYAADLSFGEIASTLDKNEPAIRMLLHRGLRKLKAVLDEA
jgi:RNA polymerase sigma-70 factor (ECF subfamily)